MNEQIQEIEQSQRVNEATIEYVCDFIRMPAKLWRDSDYETRQVSQQMMFPNGLTFDIKERISSLSGGLDYVRIVCGGGQSLVFSLMLSKKL